MYHIEEDHEPIIDIETWEAAIRQRTTGGTNRYVTDETFTKLFVSARMRL